LLVRGTSLSSEGAWVSLPRNSLRRTLLRTVGKSFRGFTLVELLAVMAIIGILAGIAAGAVTGLGGRGQSAQIESDTKILETAADRFFNASFPESYPVSPLPSGEEDLGVQAVDYDARLPQDPSKTFTPAFLKDIPNSAALVNYRIETATGRIFAADDAAAFAPPADSRLDISLSDTSLGATPDVTFDLKMRKNRAAVETMTIQIPAKFNIGGQSLPTGSLVGKLEITFEVDNPWQPGHKISVDADVVATGAAHEWEIVTDYSGGTSDADTTISVSDIKAAAFGGTGPTLTHTITLLASTSEVPGTLTLQMDREGPAGGPEVSEAAHNEATELWNLTIFGLPKDSAGGIISGETLVSSPSVSGVYRWFTEEHSTILVEDIFQPVAGKQSVVLK